MRNPFFAVVSIATALCIPAVDVSAQAPVVSLAPENAMRWDVAGSVGWQAVNKSDLAAEWNDWYDAAALGVSAGYYLTPHLKVEADISTTNAGRLFIDEPIAVPALGYPYNPPREHRFRATTFTAGAAYQFFENRWFHPFVTAGVAATYETQRADALLLAPLVAPSRVLIPLPQLQAVSAAATAVHALAGTGFKAYVSERAFVRGEVRSAFSTRQVESVVWRAGVGFDF